MKSNSKSIAPLLLSIGAISTFLFAETVYVGDVPADGKEVMEGTAGPDGANGGDVTYGFYTDTYTNESGAAQQVQLTEVNFWALNEGTLTPYVAKYNGDGGGVGSNYDVIAIGDPIEAAFGLNNASFKAEGASSFVEIADGDVLIGGFHQTGNPGLIPWAEPDETDGDFLQSNNVLPAELPGPLEADAAWSDLGREYSFNIALEFDVDDSDGDGLPDEWELANGLDTGDDGSTDVNNGPAGDPDGDTLSNQQELAAGTNPKSADTDEDTLTDNEELAGAGSRPPTSPISNDTDNDNLSDLVETNTGTYVSETDTGSNPTKRDSDEDAILDGDEVNAANDNSFFSDPNIADTDGDGTNDLREIARGHDPNDANDFPPPPEVGSIILGDVAEVDEGTIGPDGANGGDITYAFFEDAFTNESGGTLNLRVLDVNFWSINEGTLTPYIATYNGDDGGPGDNYNVLAVGDGIEGVPGLNSAPFEADGEEVFVEVESGDAIIAGFHQTGNPGMVPWESPGDADADFIQADNILPEELPGALGGDANWSDLGREYRFNVSLEEGSATSFLITEVDYDATANTVALTWSSRPGRYYAVETSPDLITWQVIVTEYPDGGATNEATSYTDDTGVPQDADVLYYRVRQVLPPAILSADFENGADGWTAVTDLGETQWELGTPNVEGLTTASSGTQAWGTVLAGNYTPESIARLRTPVVDISNVIAPELSFDFFVDSPLNAEGGQLRFLDENGGSAVVLEEVIFSGQSPGWESFSVRIPNATFPEKVIVEFAFLSDLDDVVGAGWYIDNVRIE